MLVGQRFKRRLDFFITAAEIALELVTFLFSLLIPHGVKHGFQPAQFAHVRVQEALIDCISTGLVTNSNMFLFLDNHHCQSSIIVQWCPIIFTLEFQMKNTYGAPKVY